MVPSVVALVSAGVLIFSFPKTNLFLLAWVAFVPLLLVIDARSLRQACLWAYLTGFIFFTGVLFWIMHVTLPGMLILMAYLAIYFALFAICFKAFQPLPLIPRLFLQASSWTVLEWLRANLFTGFGWALLGHSQYTNTVMIQIADMTGVYGVSFVLMLVNLIVAQTVKQVAVLKSKITSDILFGWSIVNMLLAGIFVYGTVQLMQQHHWPTVNVAVVQPNIPQEIKWLPEMQEAIITKHITLSQAFKDQAVDLIVWPETALPGVVSDEPTLMAQISQTARNLNKPLLFGAVTQSRNEYFNSALLIDRNGALVAHYDKIHLVPFGEYLPLRPLLGWINHFVVLEDFTSGKEYRLFDLPGHPKSFGALICFEDSLSYIRRNLTKAGALFWVNMTNDAWFKDTKAPFVHLQTAVFGCVEHKRALVRSANTGFSGMIDQFGRIIGVVKNQDGHMVFIDGIAVAQVPLVNSITFYTKFGDFFTFLCACAILAGACLVNRKIKER